MPIRGDEPIRFRAGTLNVEIYMSRESAGRAAASAAAQELRDLTSDGSKQAVIFATGASQLAMLHELTSLPNVPWESVIGYHMDEYRGISPEHPASFRRYMRDELVRRVPIRAFHEIDGSSANVDATCREYAGMLRASNPKLCLLGIGENGHLAFNEPFDTSFDDPEDVRLVRLDQQCRAQQVAEGWFPELEAVPTTAITLTVPTLMRVPKLIVSVPGRRKMTIVRRVIEDAISNACPATLLKTHPNATVYLDTESSAELGDLLNR